MNPPPPPPTTLPPVVITIPPEFSRELLIAAVEREIRLRERSYPRWVQLGRMTSHKMRDEIAAMKGVLFILRQLPYTPPPQIDLFGGSKK